MKKNLALMATGILLLFYFSIQAQSTVETALLFGRTRPGGSSRIQAMGGAQVSLGGDYSSAFSNPAGLGMFNRSEYSISPGMNFSNTKSSYLGNATNDSRSNFFIPGLSAVFHRESQNEGSFLGGSFAFSFNHTNNFNSNFNYQGVNSNNSIVDYFIADAFPSYPSDLLPGGNYSNNPTGLAYTTFLIDTVANSPNTYVSPVAVTPRTVNQQEDIKTKGAQKQWSLSYGANFSDRVFIGAGVGFTSLRYESSKSYRESDYQFSAFPTYHPLTSMTLNENLIISGAGINGTLGIIARPSDIIQVGFSYTTPTWYQLTDSYSANMTSAWNNFDYYNDGRLLNTESASTQTVISDYSLRTPGKINVGATAFVQKQGLITADVEFVNYSAAKYSSLTSGVSYSQENEDIKTLYEPTVNYRIGGEYRLKDFRLRAGYAFMPDPFKSEQNDVNRSISSVSGGVGYRRPKFYVDLAAVLTSGNTPYRPYPLNTSTSPLVITQNKNTTVMMTLGFPF